MSRHQRIRYLVVFLPLVLFTSISLYYISENSYQLRNTLSYATRPLWDTADGPKEIIPHYYAEGLGADAYACQLHGWKPRENSKNIKVLDAVLMSSEVDLLEIRMNELEGVVDRFFIIESNATFTGLPKERYFDKNRERFSKFGSKISYRYLPGRESDGQDAWNFEAATRDAMSAFIRAHTEEHTPDTKSLVIMSDLDEIPSAHTIRLLKACDFGDTIHLQLKNYVYSFEWLLGMNSWRVSVQLWSDKSYYRHSMSTNRMLADAGWHCSFCFRTIPEYIQKMKGFSHSDRIGGNMDLLNPKKIQERICSGKDIFGMLPEAYRYADLLAQMSLEPQTSMVGLPRYLLKNAERFKFLLPGGCKRGPQDDENV
ncbi:glycosyl transferase family 17 protein [Moniliophthora roreri MCA 2997]|uniref:Glycosyl transferase family 17 protein n=2 Tax=Moniliophthora roreri TaxID=221103 RepID=V2XLC7_MONRO|nr:glycosyl transferase family 17 protein [Moniliophthora roreri MCA 2997]